MRISRPRSTASDQPTFDALNAYFMSHAIRAAGFTVARVLSGTGGDELFRRLSHLPGFLPVLQRWSRRAAWIPRDFRPRGRTGDLAAPPLRQGGAASDPVGQTARDGSSRRRSVGAIPTSLRAFSPRFSAVELLGARLRRAAYRRPTAGHASAAHRRDHNDRTPLSAISVMEQRLFLGERLLARQRCGQHGLLARAAPAAGGSGTVRERGPPARSSPYQPLRQKALLRRIGLRGLDPALFERPKRGFVMMGPRRFR